MEIVESLEPKVLEDNPSVFIEEKDEVSDKKEFPASSPKQKGLRFDGFDVWDDFV